jgi:hypothetical protein
MIMDKNQVEMTDQELLQFRMFQEQMRAVNNYQNPQPTFPMARLSWLELRKSSYVRKSLSNDEYIVKVAILHPFAYFIAFLLVLFGLFWLGLFVGFENKGMIRSIMPFRHYLGYFFIFVGICKYFNLKMMEMVVTNKRVVCKTGIISVNTEELKNQRIESVEIKQTLWQRIWGYADIYFTGTGVSYVIFSNIRDARSVKSILEDNIDI